jgi:hypothetical protein
MGDACAVYEVFRRQACAQLLGALEEVFRGGRAEELRGWLASHPEHRLLPAEGLLGLAVGGVKMVRAGRSDGRREAVLLAALLSPCAVEAPLWPPEGGQAPASPSERRVDAATLLMLVGAVLGTCRPQSRDAGEPADGDEKGSALADAALQTWLDSRVVRRVWMPALTEVGVPPALRAALLQAFATVDWLLARGQYVDPLLGAVFFRHEAATGDESPPGIGDESHPIGTRSRRARTGAAGEEAWPSSSRGVPCVAPPLCVAPDLDTPFAAHEFGMVAARRRSLVQEAMPESWWAYHSVPLVPADAALVQLLQSYELTLDAGAMRNVLTLIAQASELPRAPAPLSQADAFARTSHGARKMSPWPMRFFFTHVVAAQLRALRSWPGEKPAPAAPGAGLNRRGEIEIDQERRGEIDQERRDEIDQGELAELLRLVAPAGALEHELEHAAGTTRASGSLTWWVAQDVVPFWMNHSLLFTAMCARFGAPRFAFELDPQPPSMHVILRSFGLDQPWTTDRPPPAAAFWFTFLCQSNRARARPAVCASRGAAARDPGPPSPMRPGSASALSAGPQPASAPPVGAVGGAAGAPRARRDWVDRFWSTLCAACTSPGSDKCEQNLPCVVAQRALEHLHPAFCRLLSRYVPVDDLVDIVWDCLAAF